ncbi:MAG: UDP-N-acetylmuramoyl-L-alanine--D-glutamate ligase [Acidobacteriaceae bacterium]|nr:UDP-N-acetylmuramoyl-L-alanine--D-glutamate ligase [Acidobacteriaceae bacterium]
MELAGKSVVVVGTKRSGKAAIDLLLKHGARVCALDAQPAKDDEGALGVPILLQTPENLETAAPDLIVLSPAVPYDLPMFVAARTRGTPVIGEVELASFFLKGPVIGITGSNGKTTTTALTGHLLKACGIEAQVGGNIGTAVTAMVESSSETQWNVLELSSFQLETIHHFRARISACLNVTPDHLDRHHTFEQYAAAKARLFETQQPGDFAVLNWNDATCRDFAKRTAAAVHWFSSAGDAPGGMRLHGDELFWDGRPFLRRSQLPLRGLHNVENVMAAAAIARLAGAALESIAEGVLTFPGVEHRIEFVRSLHGVSYFNDSKATNVDATLKAIEAFDGGLWLILGGKDKGSDYGPLRQPLAKRAKGALLIGAPPPYAYAAAPLIREALDGVLPLFDCGTLARAVCYAREHASAGDTVLFAPACASFDQFENFEERGRAFKQLVAELF